MQLIFIFISAVLLLFILGLFTRKAGLQLQYLKLQQGEDPGKISDFLRFNWSDPIARKLRWEAFLLFPMLYAVVLDEEEEQLNRIKREVKRTHILIYICIVVLVVLGVISERVFPKTA